MAGGSVSRLGAGEMGEWLTRKDIRRLYLPVGVWKVVSRKCDGWDSRVAIETRKAPSANGEISRGSGILIQVLPRTRAELKGSVSGQRHKNGKIVSVDIGGH